jgi:shikimate kinase
MNPVASGDANPTMSRIFLIGYRGSGKSTVGRHLAGRLGWAFLDADAELEARAGRTIADIFRDEGEPGFRDRESAVLADLATRPNHVIATGGGVVLRPGSRELLQSSGFVAWLQAPAGVLHERIVADPTTAARRPNLVAGGLSEIVDMLAVRAPFYRAAAHAVFDAAAASPEAVAAAILAAWTARGLL